MSITVKPTHPDFFDRDFRHRPCATARGPPTATPSRTRSTAMRSWSFTTRSSPTSSRSTSPAISARSIRRRRRRGIPASSIAWRSNEIADISNLDGDGKVIEPDSKRRLDWLANRLWHTDASFRAVPGALSMLYAHVVPDEGGDTEFADLRAAYDALPEPDKKELEGLIAEHSIWHSRGQLAVTKYTPEERASLPPVPQRVVRTHPGSKRKTLYVAAHASHIIGMPIADGRLLLLDLIEHATQRQFVHAHTWRQGDLVIWDNRCTMHRARPFDTTKVRDLRRVTTRDVASTLEQAA